MKKLILFLLLASPAFGTIAFVNSQQKVGGTTGTNGSGSISLTAGNIELVFASFYNGALNNPHVTGISDTAGDASYTLLGRFAFTDTNCNGTGTGTTTPCVLTEVWYTTIASTNATASITVTSTPTGTGTSVALHFDQYSGGAAVNTSNVQLGGAAATPPAASLTITTADANNFVVGGFGVHPAGTITASGCTGRGSTVANSGGTVQLGVCDNTSASAGTATSVGFSSNTWGAAAVELCSVNPCVASAAITNNVVIIQ